jgi:hypothetical protein
LDSGKLYMIVRSWSKQKPFDPNDEFYGLLSIADHVMLAHFLISIDGDNRDQKDSVNSRRSGRSPETLL